MPTVPTDAHELTTFLIEWFAPACSNWETHPGLPVRAALCSGVLPNYQHSIPWQQKRMRGLVEHAMTVVGSCLVLQVDELSSFLARFLEDLVQDKVQDFRVPSKGSLMQRGVAVLQVNMQQGSSWHIATLYRTSRRQLAYGCLQHAELRVSPEKDLDDLFMAIGDGGKQRCGPVLRDRRARSQSTCRHERIRGSSVPTACSAS
jgi:hypothetical protein